MSSLLSPRSAAPCACLRKGQGAGQGVCEEGRDRGPCAHRAACSGLSDLCRPLCPSCLLWSSHINSAFLLCASCFKIKQEAGDESSLENLLFRYWGSLDPPCCSGCWSLSRPAAPCCPLPWASPGRAGAGGQSELLCLRVGRGCSPVHSRK